MNKALLLVYSICLYIIIKGIQFNSRKQDYLQLVPFSITKIAICAMPFIIANGQPARKCVIFLFLVMDIAIFDMAGMVSLLQLLKLSNFCHQGL